MKEQAFETRQIVSIPLKLRFASSQVGTGTPRGAQSQRRGQAGHRHQALPRDDRPVYHVCMRRTNLVLDAQLLEEATRLSGEKTYSRTVERALEEFVRRIKSRQILSLQGSGLWEGDLGEMRRDARRSSSRSPQRAR